MYIYSETQNMPALALEAAFSMLEITGLLSASQTFSN